jgi:hypothetical protein
MNADLALTIALRGADPTALTAEHALCNRLGYASVLAALERRDFWRLAVESSGMAEALTLAGSWVTRSNLFVNPNKHIYELAATRGTARAASRGPGGRGSTRTAWVVAWSEPDIDGEAAVRLIHTRFGGRELIGARRATVWMLRFAPGVEPARTLKLADEIALARTRTRGLLTNPHLQSMAVVRASSAAAAAALVWG